MATKIINVLKDDRFEDILGLFQSTPAQEVIFVIPTKSKFLNDESHFTVLSAAAEEQSKNVLILSSNTNVTELALKYNFGVLSNDKKKAPKIKTKIVAQSTEEDEEERAEEVTYDPVESERAEGFDTAPISKEPDPEPIYGIDREAEADSGNFTAQDTSEISEDPQTTDDNIPPEEDYQIISASRINRTLDDIIKPQEEEQVNNLHIANKTEKPLELPVKRASKPPIVEDEVINQIQSVWQGKKEDWSKPENKLFKYSSKTSGVKMPGMPKFLPKKLVTLLGFAALILLGIVIYVSTGSAQIIIKPRVSPIDLNIKISASDSYQDIDPDLKRVPGQLFSIDKNVEESFPATGERDVVQKARGKITVYNEYGTTPQTLIATTRFESENGLIFHSLTTATVPGTTVKNGTITPGSIQIEVIADKAGEAYNIPAGKFTIPAFKEKGDNNRYQKFYGISKDAFKGGIIGKAKVVTDQDYVSAKKVMEEKIKAAAEIELQQQTAGLKILIAPQPEMEEIKSNAQVDEAIDTFTMTASAKIQTVGFKESDLFLFISQYIEKANNLMILPEKLKLEFQSVQFDKESHILEFIMLVKGPAYGKINQNKIISDLLGKNEGEITTYIKNAENIVSAKVLLSPFWVRKVPLNKDRVKLSIDYQ